MRDPQTGLASVKTVTARIKRLAPAVVTVCLTDSKTGQVETLTCTPEHPLYVVGSGWVEAGSLGIGSSLVSRAGPALSVTGVTWHRNQGNEKAAGSTLGRYVVYNLTVEDDHTFFVGTTGGGTWVHNLNCGDTLHIIDENLPQQKLVRALSDEGVNVTSMYKLNLEGVDDEKIIEQFNSAYGSSWKVITKNVGDFPAGNVIGVEGGNAATVQSVMKQLGPILGF